VGGQVQQWRVGEGRRHELHTERQTVCADPGRDSDRAQVQQVDEVGVCPESAVDADRVRSDLRQPGVARRDGEQQCVDFLPDWLGRTAQSRQAVKAAEGVSAADCPSTEDDRSDSRVQMGTIRLQQVPETGVPLSNPWSLIEELGRLQKGADVDVDKVQTEAARMG